MPITDQYFLYYKTLREKYGSDTKAAEALGIPRETFRNRRRAEERAYRNGRVPPVDFRKKSGQSAFIITAYQSKTKYHKPFFEALKAYRDYFQRHLGIKTQLLVLPYLYSEGEGEFDIPNELDPFIFRKRGILHDNLMVCGDISLNAPLHNPIAGLKNLLGDKWGIFGHSKVVLKTFPAFKGQLPRQQITTGTISKKSYKLNKAGIKAEFHHVFGAVIVEVDYDKDRFWIRHLLPSEDDGSFYDIHGYVTPEGVEPNITGVPGIVYGDVHVEKMDKDAVAGALRLTKKLGAKEVVLHDLIDFLARSHHHINDALEMFRIHVAKNERVADGFDMAGRFLINLGAIVNKVVVVDSNHHEAFYKWLNTADYRSDPVNAVFFLENALELYRSIERGREIDPFENALRKYIGNTKKVHFNRCDESYKIKDIEVGMHGHLGANGAKGSPRTFADIGIKSISGHTHTPDITQGHYTVGCLCQLDMGYNRGPSSWMHAVCVIWPNGKRSIIHIQDGQFSMLDEGEKGVDKIIIAV